jgi:hypothetical protein
MAVSSMTDHPSLRVVVRHALLAWREFARWLTDDADERAGAAGLAVEVLPRARRRYRDPALDGLAAHRARQAASDRSARNRANSVAEWLS